MATPMTALAIAISAMPPIMALRSPTRAATAEADRASASSAALNGSSEAPASSAVRPSRPASGDQLYFQALGLVLVHELARLNCGTPSIQPQARGGLATWQQRIVTSYIEEHLAERIDLGTLAQLVRLSRFHFCRAFKKSFGMPPRRYQINRRLEHAKLLLAEPAVSVTDIGLKMGFSDTSAFSAAYRKATGISPTGYQRNLG
jgi:AraC family transcriptional regulator